MRRIGAVVALAMLSWVGNADAKPVSAPGAAPAIEVEVPEETVVQPLNERVVLVTTADQHAFIQLGGFHVRPGTFPNQDALAAAIATGLANVGLTATPPAFVRALSIDGFPARLYQGKFTVQGLEGAYWLVLVQLGEDRLGTILTGGDAQAEAMLKIALAAKVSR